MDVDKEVNMLVTEIERLGQKNAQGKTFVKFGKLFDDERCANIFEALMGTLRAAKRRKVIDYEGEMLFQGVSNDVDVIVL